MLKYIVLAAIMALCIAPINMTTMNEFIKLVLQILLGAVIYISLLLLTKDRYFWGMLNALKERIKAK